MQKEGLLYNPVNMKIEDQRRLEEKDIREKHKKQRFDIRYEVEHDLKVRGIEDAERGKLMSLNRVSYRRYVEHLDRGMHDLVESHIGFDILTNSKFDEPEAAATLYKPFVAEKPKVWDIIEKQKGPAPPSAQARMESHKKNEPEPERKGAEFESDEEGKEEVQQPASKRSQAPPASHSHINSEYRTTNGQMEKSASRHAEQPVSRKVEKSASRHSEQPASKQVEKPASKNVLAQVFRRVIEND